MSKRKNKTSNEIPPLPSLISVTRYTEDAWMKTHKPPDKNKTPDDIFDEWASIACPGDSYKFAENTFYSLEDEFDADNLEEIQICMIDDEYFTFLKENHLKHSQKVAALYASRMSEDDAMRLLEKYNENEIIHCLFLPVTLLSPDGFKGSTSVAPSDKTCDRLTNLIYSMTQADDIYVLPYALKQETVLGEYERIWNAGLDFIYFGNRVRIDEYNKQNYSDDSINLSPLFIPVFIRYVLKSPIINLNDLCGDLDDDSDMGYYYRLHPEQMEINEVIQHSLKRDLSCGGKYMAMVYPYMSFVDEIKEYCENMISAIERLKKSQTMPENEK